jgi:hypothetical protein
VSYIKASGVHGQPGHAIIEIGYALSVDPLLLTIQKVGADPRYLARDGGWRADPEPLQPTRVERQEGRTLIYVGPDIVNHLDDDQRLRVGIVSADFAGDVVWSDIPPSSGGIGRSVFVARARPAVPVEAPPPPPAEKPKEPEHKPVVLEPPPVVPPRPPVRHTLWWALGLLLLLIVACGGAAYWYFHVRPQPVPPTAAAPVAPPNDLQRLRQQLTQMIESNGDPGQILDGGRRLIDSEDGALRDFGFRAIDVAATRGSASAQLDMGKLFDPRYFRAGRAGMERANPSVAAEWYKRAIESGSREAPAEKQGLCEKLAQPSDGIDEQVRTSTLAQYCN